MMRERRFSARLRHEDLGAAIAIVMLIGVVLVLLSSIMVARGFRQYVTTSSDTKWDNALFAAEAGLDDAMALLDVDYDYTTGETISLSVLGTEAEQAWAVTAADARSLSEVTTVPEGEYVLVRPSNSEIVFAVGYSPTRDATERRVRVIRATVQGVPWTFETEFALLAGGDLTLTGNGTINDLNDNDNSSVHTNGQLLDSGGYTVEGCLTATASALDATAECPPSPMPLEPLPVIEPRLMYGLAEFLLCDDGLIYGGGAHSTDPDADDIPCNGNETVVVLNGWESTTPGGVRTWTPKPWGDMNGVFYIYNGNFDGKMGPDGGSAEATVILEAGGGDACVAPASGSMILAGNSAFSVHPSVTAAGYDIAVVAQGDIYYEGAATVGGAILAHEQIDYRGTLDSWGAVVAVDACHTIGSPISATTMTGNSAINYPGPLKTPFTASSVRAEIIGWYEL